MVTSPRTCKNGKKFPAPGNTDMTKTPAIVVTVESILPKPITKRGGVSVVDKIV
jgi:hypothetical protein